MDLARLIGMLILGFLGLTFMQGAQVNVQPVAPKADDTPKRKPLLPWRRDVREVAASEILQPIAHWDAGQRRFVTVSHQKFFGKAQVGGTTSPDGSEEINCDLPSDLHMRNIGGTDGAGLCVWTSINHTAYWQHLWCFQQIQKRMARETGGGWPQRVDQYLPKFAKEAGVPTPKFVQFENKDIEILKLACRTGRMPGITYNFSPTGRYNGQRIAHMVSLVHASDRWFAVLDNNYPGTIEWMDPQTFAKVYTNGGNGWAVVFFDCGPPAPPRNAH